MKILSLSAENFMSFRKLSLEFPESGLFFVGGNVEGSLISNSNRAGKSSLFEALCFGLFGSTIRKTGKDDVVNWDVNKDCAVDIVFTEKGISYEIIRFRNDSTNSNDLHFLKEGVSLTGESSKSTQSMIDEILGMNWLVFSTAVIFSDKARRFADAKDAEKKEIFDEILLLHQFQEAQTMVKADIKNLNAELSKTEVSVQLIMNSIKDARESLLADKESLTTVEENKKDAVKEIQAKEVEMSGKLAEIRKFEEKKKEVATSLENLAAKEEEVKKIFSNIHSEKTTKMTEATKKFTKLQSETAQISRHLVKIKNWLSGSEDLPVGEECPTCGRAITELSIEGVKNHYTAEAVAYEEKFNASNLELGKESQIVKEIETKFDRKIEEASQEVGVQEKESQELKNKTRSLDLDIDKLKNEIKLLEKDVELIKGYSQNAEDMIMASIKSTEEKIAKYQVDSGVLEKELLSIQNELVHHKFWVDGFGNQGIKSFLLDTIVPELNNKVSYYSSMLMDSDVKIKFDTESTLKSGETRDKFNVKVLFGDKLVNYEACSSGEKGRIDATILLALQNLIFSRKASNCSFMVFDEVFEHLDSIGIERTVNLLKEEAKNKAIFLISHQQELADYFDNQIIVHNKNGISTLEDE